MKYFIKEDIEQYLFEDFSKSAIKYNNRIRKSKPLNKKQLELFSQSDKEVEILKGLKYEEYKNNPRCVYEMLNPRINEIFMDNFNLYDDEELYSFMNEDEQKAYDCLPICFYVYRGYATNSLNIEEAFNALSWTVKKEVAEFFTNFHEETNVNVNKYIFEKLIFKSDVALVLLVRGEAEIVLKGNE